MIVSSDILTDPDELRTFLLASVLLNYKEQLAQAEQLARRKRFQNNSYFSMGCLSEHSHDEHEGIGIGAGTGTGTGSASPGLELQRKPSKSASEDAEEGGVGGQVGKGGKLQLKNGGNSPDKDHDKEPPLPLIDATPLGACRGALELLEETATLLRQHLKELEEEEALSKTGTPGQFFFFLLFFSSFFFFFLCFSSFSVFLSFSFSSFFFLLSFSSFLFLLSFFAFSFFLLPHHRHNFLS